MMQFLDESDQVRAWSSEETVVPYLDPLDRSGRKVRRYFPDFVIEKTDGSVVMVEIKPSKECSEPRQTPKKSRRKFLAESATYATNQAKWEAARKFCEIRGWSFKVVTEKEMGIGKW